MYRLLAQNIKWAPYMKVSRVKADELLIFKGIVSREEYILKGYNTNSVFVICALMVSKFVKKLTVIVYFDILRKSSNDTKSNYDCSKFQNLDVHSSQK